jgi:excisionase family DNA binding protein
VTRQPIRSDAPLLTLEQVADRLGVKLRTVQRLVSTGQIRTVAVTSRVRRVTEAELAAFVASHTRGAA